MAPMRPSTEVEAVEADTQLQEAAPRVGDLQLPTAASTALTVGAVHGIIPSSTMKTPILGWDEAEVVLEAEEGDVEARTSLPS